MPRVARIAPADMIFHVLNRGNDRRRHEHRFPPEVAIPSSLFAAILRRIRRLSPAAGALG